MLWNTGERGRAMRVKSDADDVCSFRRRNRNRRCHLADPKTGRLGLPVARRRSLKMRDQLGVPIGQNRVSSHRIAGQRPIPVNERAQVRRGPVFAVSHGASILSNIVHE
jgi:hypothetical protein